MINVRLLKHKHNLTSTSQNTHIHITKKQNKKQKQKTNRSFTQEPQKCTIFQKQKHIDMHKYMST